MSRDRGGAKWDRAARYLKIVSILNEHRDGISAQKIADLIGVSKRTIYRDLEAMQLDADLPIWGEGGLWGLTGDAFLPPLDLTLHEATSLYLAARRLERNSAPGRADARVHHRDMRADGQERHGAPQHQRAVANVVLVDLMGDVDDQRLGRDAQDHAAADGG